MGWSIHARSVATQPEIRDVWINMKGGIIQNDWRSRNETTSLKLWNHFIKFNFCILKVVRHRCLTEEPRNNIRLPFIVACIKTTESQPAIWKHTMNVKATKRPLSWCGEQDAHIDRFKFWGCCLSLSFCNINIETKLWPTKKRPTIHISELLFTFRLANIYWNINIVYFTI